MIVTDAMVEAALAQWSVTAWDAIKRRLDTREVTDPATAMRSALEAALTLPTEHEGVMSRIKQLLINYEHAPLASLPDLMRDLRALSATKAKSAGMSKDEVAFWEDAKRQHRANQHSTPSPSGADAGEVVEAKTLEDHLRGLMNKIYNRGHSGLDRECVLCQAYIAADRLLSFETGAPLSPEVASWDRASPVPETADMVRVKQAVLKKLKDWVEFEREAGDRVLRIEMEAVSVLIGFYERAIAASNTKRGKVAAPSPADDEGNSD